MKKILLLIFFSSVLAQAQNNSSDIPEKSKKEISSDTSLVDVSTKFGVENPDLQTLFYFENINQTEFFFEGESIKGKYIVLRMKEFLNGELIETTTLFDERGNEYFKIDSASTSFKLLSKIGEEDLKIWLKGKNFGSKKSYFPLTHDNGRYVSKDFLGNQKILKENTNTAFHIMAVITPNRNPDGSGSYCRVAQSEIDP